jgi:rhamnosyltransferase subunit B
MARILIVGKGSYGDIFPLLAIAQRLKARGHTVDIASQAHHETATASINAPLLQLGAPAGTRNGHIATRVLPIFAGMAELFRTLSPAGLDREYETLLPVAAQADLIGGNQLAYAAAMASKTLGQPWVFCTPSPLLIPSYDDPPLFPHLHRFQELTAGSATAQRGWLRLARAFSRLVMSSQLRRQRRYGIADRRHPQFEGMYSDQLNLLLTSPLLVTPQADWPAHTFLTGFAWFEPSFMKDAAQSRRVADFLEAGPPPIIFAAGGLKRTAPGRFFSESIKAYRRLGMRAIIVAAKRFHADFPKLPDLLVTGYLPYSELLPSAAAFVHSGGIGSIGWSLRFGLPSLLVPSNWDQYDNARLALRRGLAMSMDESDYQAAAIARALTKLLADQGQRELLRSQMRQVAAEDGAAFACTKIESLLKPSPTTRSGR